MDLKKLFHVLVVGGSVIGCSESQSDPADTGAAGSSAAAATSHDAAAATSPNATAAIKTATPDAGTDDAKLNPCFCNIQPICCVQHGSDPATVAPGFECCWGTKC